MSPDDRRDFAAVSDYLFGLKPRGSKYGIDRMRLLAAELGHPEKSLPVIHVAGTNGKGSVAAMIEAILRASGRRVGLYTSPHLVHVGERVQVNRAPLSEAEIMSYVSELDPIANRVAARAGDDDRPSFFEIMTAMALLHFTRRRCDVAVLEVGLGGELDATNIVDPLVSVITSIGLDHGEYLGNTLEQVARAKAGIIKPRRPVVLGRMPAIAEIVMRETAARQAAPLVSVRAEYGEAIENYPRAALAGDYQRWNAATATLAARALPAEWRIANSSIAAGLQAVEWAGRWQPIEVGGRAVILDASHNPEGAEVLEANLAQRVAETGRAPLVVVGVLGLERAVPLLRTIARYADAVHLVVPQQPRACGFEELQRCLPSNYRGRVHRDDIARIFPGGERCELRPLDADVVVTGSIYLIGEVMRRLGRGGSGVPLGRVG